MKHCVLIKLVPGADVLEAQHEIWKTLQKLDDELDWLNRPVICRGCMEAASDFDLMAEIDLESEQQLREYLQHPLTLKLEEKLKGTIETMASFNHY